MLSKTIEIVKIITKKENKGCLKLEELSEVWKQNLIHLSFLGFFCRDLCVYFKKGKNSRQYTK